MNVNHQEAPAENIGQSLGQDPKASKRNSGLFAFLKWFKPFTSHESVDAGIRNSDSSSCESINSTQSNGTVASFSFIPPSAYNNRVPEKIINPGPETDTYKARVKQRDKRRENERNLTLRKKYNLFFNRDTLKLQVQDEDNSKSLPLMTRKMEQDQEKMHRRTASESSKVKRAGAYCHVKGKRKAPQPPGTKVIQDGNSTTSLKRKKRLAPTPPTITQEQITSALGNVREDVLFNDSLKLDHGILKSVKEIEAEENKTKPETSDNASAKLDYVEAPLSPRPWYKRNSNRDSTISTKKETKNDIKDRLSEVPYTRNSTIDLTIEEIKIDKKKEDKRKSGMSFLTNISELDREATEIIKKEHEKVGNVLPEIPEFMRPKQDSKINTESWVSPKRKSARDLIAKFNAITNVTKVTVNTAFFGSKETGMAQKYFEKQTSLDETKAAKKSAALKIEQIRKKSNEESRLNLPLMKSESANAIKLRPEPSKPEKENWHCPRCRRENDYWRIICCVCSNIKPYFDDLISTPVKNSVLDQNKTQNVEIKPTAISKNTPVFKPAGESQERILERSKTQIGFSALAKYNENQNKTKKLGTIDDDRTQKDKVDKKEEREKLKKLLIEMKNSLPKKRINANAIQTSRASIIAENLETALEEEKDNSGAVETPPTSPELKEEKTAEIIVATTETIYENIKMRRTPNPKPVKVSSSAQTSAVVKKVVLPNTTKEQEFKTEPVTNHKQNYQLMRPKDFQDIYTDKTGKNSGRIYENLAQNDGLSLFFNMPKRFSEIKNELNISANASNTDTLEINRLLKRLENAIAKGEMAQAALFARELAQLKVNCSVVRQKSVEEASSSGQTRDDNFTVEMYVEDKLSHRGPFPIQVRAMQTVYELKKQVEREFEIPAAVQRWILGKELATDDNATLADVHVTTKGLPIFLYLVAPTNDGKSNNEIFIPEKPKLDNVITNIAQKRQSTEVKIVDEVLKKPEVASTSNQNRYSLIDLPKTNTPLQKEIINEDKKVAEIVPTMVSEIKYPKEVLHTITVVEDGEYDTKTLKPQSTEWECTRCTLLNPTNSNICAVCASMRIKISSTEVEKPKRLKNKAPQPQVGEASGVNKDQHYLQLLNLDNADLVENTETFECLICFLEVNPKGGVTLRECLHQFCKLCLRNTIEYSEEAQVKCPYRDEQYSCDSVLQDREIKALVTPVMYDQYLAKSVAQAENKIDKSFHCKTPDCKGWCVFEDNANEFRCPICRKVNCLTCQAIHMGVNCKEYQERMNLESEVDENAKRTKQMLHEMINKGDALTCPTCQVILMKKWGCDWLRCSMCKTEICWVTRGPRWGPAGKGDTSGGCQCGVNGVKCHPQCNYCH